jgi:hypothetical protein
LTVGKKYKILSANGSAFTSVGAASNNIGVVFTATGASAGGTGTVHEMYTYNVDKCERDIGLVMDAVRYDMMFGTNFRTRTAAISYWRQQANNALFSGSTENSTYPQKNVSKFLFTYMKELLQTLPTTVPKAGAPSIPGISPGTARTRIGALMDLVIGMFDSSVENFAQATETLPAKPYSLPLPSGGTNNSRDLGFRAARDLIEINRDFIKAEVLSWIDDQKRENRDGFVTPFNFNRTECAEDLDLILDAVYYDMTYGGNMESYTAGLAYYSGVTSVNASLGQDEREATIRAYNYMGQLLFNVARSILNKSYQVAIEQVKGTSGSAETAKKLGELVDIVINVVKGGTKQLPPKIDPDFLSGDETLAYVRIAVQEQKFELQARIADYIDAFILQYNTEKCARDVGLILDAAMFDLVLNSNFQSITAGSVYLQKAAQVVTSTQIGPQLQAIKFIRDQVIAISQKPPLVKNEQAIGRITNLFDVMFDIIDKGVEVAPEIVNVPPQGAAFNQFAINAANSIIANKEFLKEEAVAYITANYKTYDQSRCTRDVGLIIDAVLYDLLLDTNYNSVKAGISYRRATSSLVITDQLQETLGAIDFVKKKVVDLIDDANAIASVTRSFELISSIIGGGSVPTTNIPSPGGSVYALPRPSGILVRDKAFQVAAAKLLESAEQTEIKGLVRDWILSQISDASEGSIWDGFTYTGDRQTACEEDIGFVLNAVAYDLTYGGNMETVSAGRAYYAGAANASLQEAAEIPTTLATYTYLSELVKARLEQAGVTAQVQTEAENLVLQVRNLVDSAANSVARVRLPDQSWADPLTQEISAFLVDDKPRLQDVIIDYVNNIATYTDNELQTPANYDQDKCRRDVGLVLDAVRYDLMFGTNFRTISAGRSYARSFADVITGSQQAANRKAFVELKERVLGKKLTGVKRGANNGTFTCDDPTTIDTTPLFVGQSVRVSGVYGVGNTVTLGNYANLASQPKTYFIVDTNDRTTFTLSETVDGLPIATTGAEDAVPLGLTFEIRPSVEPLDTVITQGLLDVVTLTANNQNTPLVVGREYKIKSTGTQTVTAGGFIIGGRYKITAVNSTNFTNVGAEENTIGVEFTATGAGTGTGTATFITDYSLYGAADNTVGTVFRATQTTIATTKLTAAASDQATELTVDSTAQFPATGSFIIQGEVISYSGKEATKFTGCVRSLTNAVDLPVDAEIKSLTAGTGQVETISIRESAERLFNLFNLILLTQGNVPVKQGGSGTFYNITPPSAGTGNAFTAAIKTARDNINKARQSLEDDLIDWITAEVGNENGNFGPPFSFVEASCRNDIKLILDAVTYDLTFGGNQETIVAGKAYYDGTALQDDEKLATIDSYKKLRELITTVAGADGGNTGIVQTLIDELITYIDQNSDDPIEIEADTSWVDSELYVFSDKLKAEANNVAVNTTTYINANYPGLDYNVATCQRDVKLIIEAVRWDLMFDSNFRTVTAARSYYRAQASTVIGAQKEATIDAFRVVKVTLDEFVKSDNVAQTRVAALMDIVVNTLVGGVGVLPELSLPYGATPNATDIGFLNARDRIEENRHFILEDMRSYLENSVVDGGLGLGDGTSFDGNFTTDECLRDVSLILDAVRYDLTYGGNLESVVAGRAYYAGTVLRDTPTNQAHIEATEAAYTRLATVLESVATNSSRSTLPGYSGPSQVRSNTAGSVEAAAQAKALVDTVKSYVGTNLDDDVAEIRPSTSWVDNNLALIASTMLDRKAESLPLQVTDYIDAQFPALVYNKDTCKRDIQYVVDAVRFDMMFNTNFRSWTAGKAYYRNMTSAAVVTTTQKVATLASFRYLKTLLIEIAGNNVTAVNRVKGAMNVVIDTLEQGETTRNANNPKIAAAVEVITANKDVLLANMETWLEGQGTSFTGYNLGTCLRDLGYLIDAILYDLTYGGNMESWVAGKSYYGGAVLGSNDDEHVALTKAAFTELGNKIKDLSGVDLFAVGPRVDTLIANVNALIDDESVAEVYADASWTEVGLQEVAVTVRAQTNTIKTQVTNYINTNFPTLVYNQDTCQRDVGLVIDAVRWDMLFNSNFRSITAGRSYWRSVANEGLSQVDTLGQTANQKIASIAAFTYLKDLLLAVAAGNKLAQERITNNIDIVLQILETGLSDQENPTITYPTPVRSENARKAKDILLANKAFIQDEIINYINSNFNAVFYDEEKCARDVELISTAIAYDMVQDGNFNTIRAAQGYLRANASNVLTPQQKHITILSMKYLKNLLTNYVGGNPIAKTRVKELIEIVINTINKAALSVTEIDYGTAPVPEKWDATNIAGDYTNDSVIKTIIDDVISYVETPADGYTVPNEYNQIKCKRDLQFILEGLRYDLTHGGNWASVVSARSYYVGTENQLGNNSGEVAATLRAFEYLKTQPNLLASIEGEVDVGTVNVPNIVTAEERVADLIEIIRTVIQDKNAIPAIDYPELLGSDNELEAARNVLISNVENAKAKVIRYTNDRAYFVYDPIKCERDLELILDAIHTDIVTNSNFLSIQAGRSYLRASAEDALKAAQKWAILSGLTHAKSVLSARVSTNAEMVSRIRNRLSNIIDIINDESDSNVALILTNSTTTYSAVSDRQNSAAAIQSAKATLIDDVITSVADVLTDPNDENACRRDLSYIIDALSHDVLYGGNWGVTVAAKAYWENGQLALGPIDNERVATLEALDTLKDLINALPNVNSDAEITALISRIKAVLDNADTDGFDGETDLEEANALTITAPTLTGATQAHIDANTTLVAAKDASTYDILDYINSRTYLEYDSDKCQRDIGIILDALRFDQVKNSNFKSIKAGQAYLRSYSKTVIEEQKQATIGALYFVKKQVSENLLQANVPTADINYVRSLMNIIIDILDRGETAIPEAVIPAEGTGSTATILNNKDFIKAEVRAYIEINYPELDYNKITCERDVAYILDALRYDLAVGGNSETIEAGLSYWEGNALTLGTGTTVTSTLVTAGNFVIGQKYQIATLSSGGIPVDTDFTLIGASSNTVGVVFTATGNGESNGNGQAFLVVGVEEQKLATVGAYAFLADLVKSLLDNNYSVQQQSVVKKGVYVGTPDSLSLTAKTLITNIKNIVNSENFAAAQALANNTIGIVLPGIGTSLVNTTIVAATTNLPGETTTEINKAFINSSTGLFVAGSADNVQFFVYNQDKCSRDVGFVIDALAFDLFFGGNKETREAALQYAYKGGLVIPLATKVPTVGGFTRLKNIMVPIVTGQAITRSIGFDEDLDQETEGPSNTEFGNDARNKVQIVIDVLNGKGAPVLVEPDAIANKTADLEYLAIRELVKDSVSTIASQTIKFINETYAGFGYEQDTCKRDIGLTLDAVAYDLIYGGNSRTKFAAEQYYSGGRFQIPADSKSATVACFVYLDALIRKVIKNEPIVTFQNYVDQNKSNQQATDSEVLNVASLMDAYTDILSNGYISVLQLDATFNGSVDDNTFATFHQVSTITTTGHTLEWVGTGIDVDSALPYNGGVPKPENQLVSERGGFINFTSTDEKGDFRIGPDLTIKRDSGSIVGRAFNKSLLGVITPYILALQG